jgi:hypothetical protein
MQQRSTVLWLVEQSDDGSMADASVRALTFARSLADGALSPAGGALSPAASSASAASQAPVSTAGGPGGVVAVVFGGAASVPLAELSPYGVRDAYAV